MTFARESGVQEFEDKRLASACTAAAGGRLAGLSGLHGRMRAHRSAGDGLFHGHHARHADPDLQGQGRVAAGEALFCGSLLDPAGLRAGADHRPERGFKARGIMPLQYSPAFAPEARIAIAMILRPFQRLSHSCCLRYTLRRNEHETDLELFHG